MAPEPGVVEPSCVAASGLSEELSALQSRVLDTLTEARAPSTRRLYALKWGVFVKWCGQAHIDPATCTVSDVLSFLQYRLDSGSLPSTLKVYVAAIALFRSPQGGQSIGRHAMVVSFLKGAKRLHPPHPPSVPPWDLEVVLRALSQPPFEPLTFVDLKDLSLKTTLLLALASPKRIGDLHAFSVDTVVAVITARPAKRRSASDSDVIVAGSAFILPLELVIFACDVSFPLSGNRGYDCNQRHFEVYEMTVPICTSHWCLVMSFWLKVCI